MSNARKKTEEQKMKLKNIDELIEQLEDLEEKQMTCVASQKEKHEVEMKKTIKKLQRLREDMKSCLINGEYDKNLIDTQKGKIEKRIELFKVKVPEVAKKISLKNQCVIEEAEELEVPEWLNRAIVSIEQKIGTIKNSISSTDKKNRKKQKSTPSTEDFTKVLENLNTHKDAWKKLATYSLLSGFYADNAENYECLKNSVQDLIREDFDELQCNDLTGWYEVIEGNYEAIKQGGSAEQPDDNSVSDGWDTPHVPTANGGEEGKGASSSESEEEMFCFGASQPPNHYESLQYSYKSRPRVEDITFPRKYQPKRYMNFSGTNLPAEIAELGHNIPEEHQSIQEKETLFYIFQIYQGTFCKYLAAKELQNRNWLQHKKQLTWFNIVIDEETVQTDELIKGHFLQFDWESGWNQRLKSDFKFETRYLEKF